MKHSIQLGAFLCEAYSESIEELVGGLLLAQEDLQVLVDTLLDGHAVEVPDRVFAEEVKLDNIVLLIVVDHKRVVQPDVLHAQAAAAHCVRLVLVLLVARTQRQLNSQCTFFLSFH